MQGTSTARQEQRNQPNVVGQLLRDWRTSRGMSQLELAMQAGFSPRHVSFIETGRAQPSRHALLVIAESLDIPLRERNRLLEAGGYAPVYRHTPLAAEEMAHIRGVLQFILDRHAPYAAVVLDRYSNVVMGNAASARLVTTLVDASLLAEPLNYLRVTFHPQGARRWIVNWDELSRHLLARTELELGLTTSDPRGAELLDELRRHMGSPDIWRSSERITATDLLVPIHIRKAPIELRLFCTFMTLGTPQDVTLQELRIETFFPADEASERTWREAFGEG